MKHENGINNNQAKIRKALKIIAIIFSLFLAACVILIIAAAIYLNYRVSHHPNQLKFDSGVIPTTQFDGFYEGKNFNGLGDTWMGKTFDSASNSGINTFTDGNRIKFKVYEAQGLRDDKTVLRLDYNLKGNPLWMRFIKDEIVETSPNNYLGKVTFKIIPGLPFTVTYFELSKNN